jgi:hypothetical protein
MRATVLTLSLAFAAGARSEQFWCEYDPSWGLYPEECGWDRLAIGGGAQRSLDGGVLTLDSSASPSVIDCYGISRPIELGPGESFVVEWRLRVNEVHGAAHPPVKPNVHVAFDGYGMGNFAYSERSLYCWFEDTWISFEPYVFHDYSLTTSDLLTYTLGIDGTVVYAGLLATPCYGSGVDWGDEVTGATSVSDWDYVRFGVVPEPPGALSIISACIAGIVVRAR